VAQRQLHHWQIREYPVSDQQWIGDACRRAGLVNFRDSSGAKAN
jgi:hypothetical protein